MAYIDTLRHSAKMYNQEHIFRFWDELDDDGQKRLQHDVSEIDFALLKKLLERWVYNEPEPEKFLHIDPVPTIPMVDPNDERARIALDAGEAALRAGRVGLFLVAGGQGTRLGYDGPKGTFPIGPITQKTLFEYHAEKIRKLQARYDCVLPWYIMVSEENHAPTEQFFKENDYLGLKPDDIKFLEQDMMPCVDEAGKILLAGKDKVAKNPNGHGGCIPAMEDTGVLSDAARRGVDLLFYFQVDNWAVNLADPYFLGYHLLNEGDMSSKVHLKQEPHESVGVHCLCDREYRIIEYSELDIYPQLLDTDENGELIYNAGNPAIHIFSTPFLKRIADTFDEFPWHRAHKKIPHIDTEGNPVDPVKPNGYKFETFVFDALRYIQHDPIALEIPRVGEYTPIKQPEGPNSVAQARQRQANYWGAWLDAAGKNVPRDQDKNVTIPLEISPLFALDQDEFVQKAANLDLPDPDGTGGIAIGADGSVSTPPAAP